VSDRPYPPLRPQVPPRPRRRATPWALVIGIVVLAVLALVLAIILLTRDDGGSADGSPGASPTASGAASPSAETSASATAGASVTPAASAGPTPVVAAPDGILPVGSIVEVVADGLRLRDEPSTDGAVVATVAAGEVLYLVTNPNTLGPVEGDGYQWYIGMHAPGYTGWPNNPPGFDDPSGDPRVSGWFAAGNAGESFVSLEPARCTDDEVTIQTLYGLTPWERLACLGDRQLTIEGTFGCGGCGGLAPGTFEPEWLTHPINFNILGPPWAEGHDASESLVLRVPPAVPQLDTAVAGSILRVVGHFNDAISTECEIAPGGSEVPADDVAAEWYCREQFVVEAWESIGTDPDYQGS
jgi:hypothetical protein